MSAQSIPQTQNWKTLSGLSNIIRAFSINEDLLPGTTLVYSLGSAAYRWLNLHVQNIFATDADIGTIDCTTLNVSGTATLTGLAVTNVTASGILAGNSLSITTNGTVNGNFTVGNDLYVAGSFDVGAFSCTSMVCTGSATFGASITASSISSTGSISGQAFSCTALTCSGAVSAATISAPTLTITGSTAMGTGTPALITSAGLVTVQNATDISLVNTNASITTAGGIYVAKSIRCIGTVNAATYSGSGGIGTTSNSSGFSQGTGVPSGSPVNYFTSTTEIGGLLTCGAGITVASGTTTTGAISATTIQTSGLITCNAGITVAAGTTTLGTSTAATISSTGVLSIANVTDTSLVNTNASITTAGGIYVAKSIRCIGTVNATTYSGSGGIGTTSNSSGFSQGTGVPSGTPVNYFSGSTEIGGVLTCTNSISLTPTTGQTFMHGNVFSGSSSYNSIGSSQAIFCGSYPYTASNHSSQLVLLDNSSTLGNGGNCGAIAFAGPAKNFGGGGQYMAAGRIRAVNTAGFYAGTLIFESLSTAGNLVPAMTIDSSQTVTIGTTNALTVTTGGVLTVNNAASFGTITPATINASGVLEISNTSNATSFTSGAFRCSGGASVSGTLYSYMYFGAFIANAATFTNSNNSNQTYVITDIYSLGAFGIYRRSGMTAIRTDTLPTPASIAAYTSVAVGTSLHFVVSNASSSDMILDVPGGCTRNTLAGSSGAGTINPGQHRRVTIVMTNVSSGTETYTAYL